METWAKAWAQVLRGQAQNIRMEMDSCEEQELLRRFKSFIIRAKHLKLKMELLLKEWHQTTKAFKELIRLAYSSLKGFKEMWEQLHLTGLITARELRYSNISREHSITMNYRFKIQIHTSPLSSTATCKGDPFQEREEFKIRFWLSISNSRGST